MTRPSLCIELGGRVRVDLESMSEYHGREGTVVRLTDDHEMPWLVLLDGAPEEYHFAPDELVPLAPTPHAKHDHDILVDALAKADAEVVALADALRAAGVNALLVQKIIDEAKPRAAASDAKDGGA